MKLAVLFLPRPADLCQCIRDATVPCYGGYDAERDRIYWKEFTFHHCLGECGLPGPFPGRTGRQWQATIDEPIYKTPGGIRHEAYQQLLKHCGATADFIIHRYRLGLSGKLLRGRPTTSTLLMKARTPGSGYSTFNRFPGITPPCLLYTSDAADE